MLAYVATRRADARAAHRRRSARSAALLLLFVLVRRVDELLPWAIVLLGVAYAIALFARGGGDRRGAPLVGAGLLLCARARSVVDRRALARSRAERAVVVARGVAVGAARARPGSPRRRSSSALAAAPVGGGLGWTVLGAAAAVLVVALAARLAA